MVPDKSRRRANTLVQITRYLYFLTVSFGTDARGTPYQQVANINYLTPMLTLRRSRESILLNTSMQGGSSRFDAENIDAD